MEVGEVGKSLARKNGSTEVIIDYADNASFSPTPTNGKVGKRTVAPSSTNPTVSGQSVTLTPTVGSVAPGSTATANPTGSVAFYDNGTAISPAEIVSTVGGVTTASFTTALLSTSGNLITAIYSGDGDFAASTSGILTQTIDKAATSITLVASVDPAVIGESVTYTASMSAVSPGKDGRDRWPPGIRLECGPSHRQPAPSNLLCHRANSRSPVRQWAHRDPAV